MTERQPNWAEHQARRAIDIIGVAFVAPAAFMGSAATAGAISVVDRVNPFYSQERYGYGLRPFKMHKFRTMPEDTFDQQSDGPQDARRSRLGSLLSSWHIDELPQLLNVAKGDMSIVGLRPLPEEDIFQTLRVLTNEERYAWVEARVNTRAGIISPFSISQSINAYRSNGTAMLRERAYADIDYSDKAGFRTDLSLIAKTVISVVHNTLERDVDAAARRGERTVKSFTAVARGYGFEPTQQEQDYWRASLLALRYVDDVVDEEGADCTEDCIQDLILGNGLPGMNTEEAEFFEKTYLNASDHQQTMLTDALREFPERAARLKAAASVDDLKLALKEEQEFFVRLFQVEEVLPPHVLFNDWMNQFWRLGYSFDFLQDAKSDAGAGCIRVEPSGRDMAKKVAETVREGLSLVHWTPRPAYKPLAQVAMRTLVTKNR